MENGRGVMIRTFLAGSFILASLSLRSAAEGAGTGCLSGPLPTTPVAPVFTRAVQTGSQHMLFTVWRQSCPSGGSIVLLRVTPLTVGPFLCDVNLGVIQSAAHFEARLTDDVATDNFCGTLSGARTFYVAPEPGSFAYDPQQAFILFFDTVEQSPRLAVLEVGPAGPTSPAPPSVAVILIDATHCIFCRPGDRVGFNAQVFNPGLPTLVEVKGGVRLPDGQILGLLSQTRTLPSGVTVIPLLPSTVVPAGLPTVDVRIEAAILEPELGLTLARHYVILRLLP
jgi:hypothetical protein